MREGRCRYGLFMFDNPGVVEDWNQLRYSIALVFDKRMISQELDQALLNSGLGKVELPKSKVLRTSFPYKNTCSYKIGSKKAWPMLFQKSLEMKCKFILDMKSGGCIEFYNFHKIQYYLPIENFERFYITKIPPPKLKKGVTYNQKKTD